MIKPRQIEAFRAVVEAGSVTRAAERLRITQPAVSNLIMEFERSTRLKLFDRHKRRMIPTPEARLLAEEVDRVFLGIERLDRFAEDIREKRIGHLHIGCLPSLGLRIVPDLVANFIADKPQLRLTTHVRTSQQVVDWVLGQQIDVGISLLKGDHPSVEVESLIVSNAVCVLPLDHPLCDLETITPKNLREVPFIRLGHEDRSEQMISRVFDQAGVKRQVRLETNLSSVACQLVAAGAGVSVVDPFAAMECMPSTIAVRPFSPAVTFEMWLLFPAHRPKSQLLTAFISELRTRLSYALATRIS